MRLLAGPLLTLRSASRMLSLVFSGMDEGKEEPEHEPLFVCYYARTSRAGMLLPARDGVDVSGGAAVVDGCISGAL
jgi:hypothetical protein